MVSADPNNENAVFLWHCLKSSQANAGKVDNETVGQIYKIKPNAVHMRLFRFEKQMNAMEGVQGGEKSTNENGDSAKTAPPKAKATAKAKGAGKIKGKKRKAEEENVFEHGENDEEAPVKPLKTKKPKTSPAVLKVEEGEEDDDDKAVYDNGGTVTENEDGGI